MADASPAGSGAPGTRHCASIVASRAEARGDHPGRRPAPHAVRRIRPHPAGGHAAVAAHL